MPAAVMCSRGAGFPGHGSADSDLAVIAPSRDASPSFATSAPCPYVPDAVTIGFGNVNPPSVTSIPHGFGVAGPAVSRLSDAKT